MQMINILLKQLFLMFIYMISGYILYRKNIVNNHGAENFGKLLLYIVLPATIIKSYNISFAKEKAIGLLISFVLAMFSLIISILVSKIVFKERKNAIESFGAAFSNAGFIGIPLVQIVLGSEAVFYAAAFVSVLNILQWTYGLFILTNDRKVISLKKIVFNPILISFIIGIFIFLLPFNIPKIFIDTLNGISSMNGPLAMIIIGIYLAQVKIKEVFTKIQIYKVSFVRLILIPAITLILLTTLPSQFNMIKFTILILASAPIGSNLAIFAQITDNNYKLAVKQICLSTLLCIITMPLIIGISVYIW